MVGKWLGGRYEIVERLGGGGMAVVYKARDRVLERHVAVKIMNESLSHDQEFIRRFHREAKAAGSLSHPNVVNVYDVGREGNIHYIVMEYIDGKSLMERIEEQGFIPPDEAVSITLQILEGLAHAHENGIVHRDIKPHNIMMTSDGRYKLTDFGISRTSKSSTITQTGLVMGSVHYFSPEQARGREVGFESDLYSMGVVLFQMVTGQLPFDGDEAIAIALKHLQDPVPDPRSVHPGLPDPLCDVILRSLEKDKEKRFQSAREMMSALRNLSNRGVEQSSSKIPSSVPAQPGLPSRKSHGAESGTGMPSGQELFPTRSRRTSKRRKKKMTAILLSLAVLIPLFLFGIHTLTASEDSSASGKSTPTSRKEKEQTDDGWTQTASEEETKKKEDASDPEDDEEGKDPEDHPENGEEPFPEDPDAGGTYPWWNEVPQGSAQNDSFRNTHVSGTDGQYHVSLEAKVPPPQFYYYVTIVDGDGPKNMGHQSVPYNGTGLDYAPAAFNVSIPQDQLPQKGGFAKITIYSQPGEADKVEFPLQQWQPQQ